MCRELFKVQVSALPYNSPKRYSYVDNAGFGVLADADEHLLGEGVRHIARSEDAG